MLSAPPPPPPDAERNSRSVEGRVRTEELKNNGRMVGQEGDEEEGDATVEVEEDDEEEEQTEGEEGFNLHEIHEMGGIRAVGGVSFINQQTSLFCDFSLRQILNSDERWRAYLQFREEACQIAAAELVSLYGLPVDLVEFTDADAQEFSLQCFDYIMMYRNHSIIANGNNNGCADKISNMFHLTEKDIKCHNNMEKEFLQTIVRVRRYFAYRKGLLKLDFIQSNSDPEYVLERLRSLNLWSELPRHERRLGLESHMNLLKELEKTKSSSQSEYENLALENINLELGSKLQGHLDDSDRRLMNQYYHRKQLMNLARECAIQAEATGYILCEQALPIRSMEQIAANQEVRSIKPRVKLEGTLAKLLPYIKQIMKQSLEGPMRRVSEKLQTGSALGKMWQLGLACALTAASLATAGNSGRR